MRLKLLVPLTVLIFFNFVYCFTDSEYLKYYYKKEVLNNDELQKINSRLCLRAETNVSIRLQLCQPIFKFLRNDPTRGNPFWHALYMNYDAFIDSSNYPVCEERSIMFETGTAIRGRHENLTCYGRLAVLSENDSSFLREISIFIGWNNTVIVFRCPPGFSYCTLLHWIEKNLMIREPAISYFDLIIMKVPRTASKEKLNSVLKNLASARPNDEMDKHVETNTSYLLHDLEVDKFGKLCRMLLERPQYRAKCQFKMNVLTKAYRKYNVFVEFTEKIPESSNEVNQEILPVPDSSSVVSQEIFPKPDSSSVVNQKTFSWKAYPCVQYVSRYSYRKTFKIMTGLDKRSVIILEPVMRDEESLLIPVELIENLDSNYINIVEEYF